MNEIVKRVIEHYKEPKLELEYSNPFELLIALILSARCLDKTTNKITKEFFKRFKTPCDIANSSPDEVNMLISSCSMHNSKAKSIFELSKILCDKFDNKVTDDFDELIKLPGVGEKTANILLAFGFSKPTIGVDTHVARVCKRLGISKTTDPKEVEESIKSICEKQYWVAFFSGLILHGRYICTAKKAHCDNCFLSDLCAKNI
ncbi:MAG: endonuclease III [Desulfurella sp.]|uniref:endonuclease III n=1 Tax=Desulfurella sp. TaxID=1962857 RepID=UPI000CB1F620|nr:endonuclease III [Desulfurella sp.]PMP87124.1 MAG: endonuclease III [Desulfurella sp.]